MKRLLMICIFSMVFLIANQATAVTNFAVWADGRDQDAGNQVDDFINTIHRWTATLVTDAQLATPGFLDSFNVLVATRFGAFFGTTGFSSAAAAQVKSWATGNAVLFANDLAENLLGGAFGDPGDTNMEALFKNGLAFAAESGHGFVGELNGTYIGINQLALFPGASASYMASFSPSLNVISATGVGAGSPIWAGVSFPFTGTDQTTYRSLISGVSPSNVYATFGDGNPFIVAIPEPATICLLSLGGLAVLRRRRSHR